MFLASFLISFLHDSQLLDSGGHDPDHEEILIIALKTELSELS